MVAERLGEVLREQMVFVGGAIAGLLITDPAMPAIRPTDDVDLLCQAAVLADYHAVENQLRDRGFAQDMRPDAPICRWRVGALAVDLMPTLDSILGFSNRWYPLGMDTANRVTLPSGQSIRLISAPVFLATKLEAFAGRGHGDYLFSHDMGDLLAVIDGRDAVLDECRESPSGLRSYLAQKIQQLVSDGAFLDAIPGHLSPDSASQERASDLVDRLRLIAALC